MPQLGLFVFGATLVAASLAEARPNTTTMTCEQAAATVSRAGLIVLSTGEFTYDRFVASIEFCAPRQQTEPAFAPTRDAQRCQVGFVCRRPNWFPDND